MAAAANAYGMIKNIYGSLPVESVQLLAVSCDQSRIPERYVRPEMHTDPVLHSEDDGGIPVINMSRLVNTQYSQEEVMKLGRACQEWGFFQLINHGVPEEVIERMKREIQGFFQLPSAEKKTYAQRPGSVEGYGQAFVLSENQKLDWGDMYLLATRPPLATNLEFWATNPPLFRTVLAKYALELERVASILLGSMANDLGSEQLADMFKEAMQTVRMNYYPPCHHANKVLGLSPHSDTGGLTLLLQVNEVEGLQIKKNGRWMPVKPLSNAFIVNIGDTLEIMSNGKYKSIEHRAVINPEKERMSIATFVMPRLDVPIGPIPELVEGTEELYKTLSVVDHFKLIMTSKLEGKSVLDMMKLKK